MPQLLQTLSTRFEALNFRERFAVTLLVATVLMLVMYIGLIEPQLQSQTQLRSQLDNTHMQLAAKQKQLAALKSALSRDPDLESKQRLARLEAQKVQLDQKIREKMQGLIEPKQMAQVLEAVLTQKTDLRLERLKNLPTRPLLDISGTEGNSVAEAGVYRHAMQIEFRGSYLSMFEYLKALKALPWKFYWDSLSMSVERYPRAYFVITLHTLSFKEGWIGV